MRRLTQELRFRRVMPPSPPKSMEPGLMYWAGLIFLDSRGSFLKIYFPPILLAEVAMGLYLILFAVGKREASASGA